MTARCPHCNAVAVTLPNPLWRVAHAGAWGYAGLSVLGASLIGPMIIGIIPVLLFGGVCLLSETHRRAHATPCCDACGRYVSSRSAWSAARVTASSSDSTDKPGRSTPIATGAA